MNRIILSALGIAILSSGAALATTENTATENPALKEPAKAEQAVKMDGNKDKFKKYFNRFDDNKDGVVSKDEFMKGQEAKFSKIDTNKDGKISKEEMQAHHAAMMEKRKKWSDKKKMKENKG